MKLNQESKAMQILQREIENNTKGIRESQWSREIKQLAFSEISHNSHTTGEMFLRI